MARKYFSPYAPRRRRSPQVVVIWVSIFVFLLWLTWFITTRHKEEARPYVDEFMHPRAGRAHVPVVDVGPDGPGEGEERGV
ncbi:uncharacterized protein C8A04DRAFT_31535 [Dichotomopilus funicola]|uniref:Uncharacterized protein n=1 Tax=Dichotomopilus funicola TaxID=1934379 RepID=A0AAN6UXJ8_9PEZI|nr:hypothetical protein C8A04DRAFT_31535 [Dichotomopilus funicola]